MAKGAKSKATKSPAETQVDQSRSIIDATMRLASDMEWEDIRLSDIAMEAEIGLADLRYAFDSKGAILRGFARMIDEAVLSEDDPDMADESPRERVFDVMMRRFDALRPYQEAISMIADHYRGQPFQLLQLNRDMVRSMAWMLEASGIDASGPEGRARAQVLAVVYARTLRVFLKDRDAGLARTMAALDRNLRSAERFGRQGGMLMDAAKGLRRMVRGMTSRRRSRRDDYDEDAYDDDYGRDDEAGYAAEASHDDDPAPASGGSRRKRSLH